MTTEPTTPGHGAAILADPDTVEASYAALAAREQRENQQWAAERAAENVILDAIASRRRRWGWLLGKGYRNDPITASELHRVGVCGQPEAFLRLVGQSTALFGDR